jgi:sugar phosphate isomerase/epimerase
MIVQLDPPALQRCFSTLGCADLSFPEICRIAGDFQIPALELRGIDGRMDMPQHCLEKGLTPARLLQVSDQHQTRILVVGSSVKLTSATEKDREELLELGTWAEALHAPYLRVFGGGTWGKPLATAEYAHAVELINWWRQERTTRKWQVDLLLETHDAFSGSEPCVRLNQLLTKPLGLIWDTHHTWRIGGESPKATWKQIGDYVRHVQIKDSVDKPSARHPYSYVLPGDGQMPLREVMALLQRENFSGFVSLEWERHWHPYLPPLRDALARMQAQNWFIDSAGNKTALAPELPAGEAVSGPQKK